jgi:hypothetical protein
MATDITQLLAPPSALAFAVKGYGVVMLHGIKDGKCTCGNPQCGSPGKHPFARFAPHGLKDATTDLAKIRAMFAEEPDLNYGVITDNLPTADIDPRNGGDKSWQRLIGENYLVHTWQVQTGGGGQHLIFGATSEPIPSGKLAPGIEFQSVGKYIVGVGSLHISGRRYRWYRDANPTNTELKAPPRWILDQLAKQKPKGEPIPSSHWDEMFRSGITNGNRNESFTQIIGHLLAKHVDPIIAWSSVKCINLCSPDPWGEEDLASLFNRIQNYELKRGLSCR